jgi:hypothetical protein
MQQDPLIVFHSHVDLPVGFFLGHLHEESGDQCLSDVLEVFFVFESIDMSSISSALPVIAYPI